jgi:pimeloyl-ACP methyl ester carboxylesterase
VPVALIVLVSSMLLFACAPADGALREINFDTSDGGRIHANLYGDGAHGVVLAHGAVFNKESWHEQAERLAEAGLRVLAIDFRGYGDSKPGSQGRALHLDILGAIAYLKAAGCDRVSVVGGSMGGGAAAQAAVEAEPGSIDRLILLAHSTIDNPGAMQGKKLFIMTKGDSMSARRPQFDKASEPKKWVVLEGSAHAQHIFKTPQADELMQHILDWLTN